ncbi:MAG TPA: hypothetical protein DEB06_10470, partial [Phycisphaerales bacterium]|nr:hypothetical protein [Phycisphaerales bacterium]
VIRPPDIRPLDMRPADMRPASHPLDALTEAGAERRAQVGGGAATIGAPSPLQTVARNIVAATARSPIEDELASIKRMVGHVFRSTRTAGHPSMPEALFDCYLKLIESEVASEIADEITGAVRDELDPAELDDPAIVQQAVLRRLAGFIPVCNDPAKASRAPDGRPLTIALIGPTGVGKTTTIAKLAATYKLRHGRKVGLITCDTYRIAAVDQLRTYANIIGLPLKVVLTPAEMRAGVDSLSECDAVLIDTAGRSPRDHGRLDELRAFLDAARPHQTHLVLSSTAGESCLADAAARFAPLGCDRLILTKLDEAVNFGVLVNIARKVDARLSFVTTGQEVPDHIEPGNPDRLARMVMSGPPTP